MQRLSQTKVFSWRSSESSENGRPWPNGHDRAGEQASKKNQGLDDHAYPLTDIYGVSSEVGDAGASDEPSSNSGENSISFHKALDPDKSTTMMWEWDVHAL